VIRVYDAAGKLIEVHRHKAISKSRDFTTTSLVSYETVERLSASLHPVWRGGFLEAVLIHNIALGLSPRNS